MDTSPTTSAIKILASWLTGKEFAERLLEKNSGRINHPQTLELLYGCIRNLSCLELIIAKYCRKSPSTLPKATLLIGIYQLLYTETPDYAVVNNTVLSAKELKTVSAGLVNGVLRNIARNKETCHKAIEEAPIYIRKSHAKEFVTHLTAAFGEEKSTAILDENNSIPQTFAIPLPYTDTDCARKIIAEWKYVGIEALPTTDNAIPIPHGVTISKLPGYDKGTFIIQDPATLNPIRLLSPVKGETILDCCAAPGGKTMQIASSLNGNGLVIASDKYEQRLRTLSANAERSGLTGIIRTLAIDATKATYITAIKDILGNRKLSAVLADVPCSNTGVFRRRIDAKWRWSLEETMRLQGEQLAILQNIARLNPERIVYSTCSIDPIEDENVVRLFLNDNKDYILSKESKLIQSSDGDGSYAALLIRK